MSLYCTTCGALIKDDCNFCESCGTAVVKTEKKTCKNCGTLCNEEAKFCRICRTPLEDKITSDAVAKLSSNCLNDINSEDSNSPAKPIITRGINRNKLTVKRKSSVIAVMASVLVLALVVTSVSIGVKKCDKEIGNDDIKLTNITYSENELKVTGTKINVSPENPVATEGEVIVDFGAFILYGESTLEVKTLAEKSDSRTGVTVQAYDFSLSDNTSGEMLSKFPTLVDITIPCTASADEYAFVQYYNKETKGWQIIDSKRDYKNNTLTFQTTHFSIYGESKMILGSEYNFNPTDGTEIPSQSFSYVGGYDGPLTEVYFVSADLDKLMDSLDFDKMIEILNSCRVYPEDMATALMGLGNDAANVLDLNVTNKLINTILRAESGIQNWANSIRLVGSALVFAKVAYQLYIGGDVATVAYINAVNLTEALLTVAGVALGSNVLLTMAMVVFLSNTVYAMATLEVTSIQEEGYINFNDGLGAVFYAESMHVAPRELVSLSQPYYTPSGPIVLDRGGKGFARALDSIYVYYNDKPADLQKAVENLINEYVDCFWDSKNLTDADRVKYAYYKEKYDAENPPIWVQPSSAAIEGYKNKFREKLMSDIKPLMKEFSERVLYDLKLELRYTIEKEYVPFLNTVITVQGEVKADRNTTFDKTEYGTDYSMRFSPQQSPFWVSTDDYNTNYNPHTRADSNEIYKSTVYNFLQLGDPAEIEFTDEVGQESSFYAEIDWSTFPAGSITLTKEPVAQAVTLKSKYSFNNVGEIETQIILSIENMGAIPIDKDGNFSVTTTYSFARTPFETYDGFSYQDLAVDVTLTLSGNIDWSLETLGSRGQNIGAFKMIGRTVHRYKGSGNDDYNGNFNCTWDSVEEYNGEGAIRIIADDKILWLEVISGSAIEKGVRTKDYINSDDEDLVRSFEEDNTRKFISLWPQFFYTQIK